MLKKPSLTTFGAKPLYKAVIPSFRTMWDKQSTGFLYMPGEFICLVVQISSGDPKMTAVNPAPNAQVKWQGVASYMYPP